MLFSTSLLRRKPIVEGVVSNTINPLTRSAVSTASHVTDDKLLRDAFDSPQAWSEFTSNLNALDSQGLLMNSRLNTADSLVQFAVDTLHAAQRTTGKILAITTEQEMHGAIRLLDRLSDMLCRVIDLAEFIRTIHPDPNFVRAAEYAYEIMISYMIQLNSSDEMYHILRKIVNNPNVYGKLSREENIVANLLLHDFEKSGAALDLATRERVMKVQHDIDSLSREFMSGIGPEHDSIQVDVSDLMGLDPTVVLALKQAAATPNNKRLKFGRPRQDLDRVSKVSIPTTGPIARMVAVSVHSSKIREQLYVEGRRSHSEQTKLLDNLLRSRMNLASLLGAKTYAEYKLSDKMARTPESVNRFLDNLAFKTHPGAAKEIELLKTVKQNYLTSISGAVKDDGQFNEWDRDYYLSRYLENKRAKVKTPDFLNSFFSVGTVMQGLSRLFTKLYGIRFAPREVAPGEVWHGNVRKLDIMAETTDPLRPEQRIGIMYCDFFGVSGKPRNPAHYTVRCSRRIFDDELIDGLDPGIGSVPSLQTTDGHLFQVPTVSLVCDFSGKRDDRPCLLSFEEVETLFHEMGHAMHSMLGRTALHNISGTRCSTDFVELPSVLMEYFASAPDVLALYARHYETDEPLPHKLLEAHLQARSTLRYNDSYSQIKMSLLDQSLHSLSETSLTFNSSEIYHNILDKYSVLPPVRDATWQGMFGHLVGYGAVYYSYLLDRAIASHVWSTVFKSGQHGGAISRQAGEKFKNEVLIWGGGRDAWECLAGALNRPELAKGGEDAMEIIAKGAGEEVGGTWR
ncbi:hypothetical protein V1514DRAFT_323151 [Lipomyces japonicus]|uniref:uncharacterized protein n=1 Tax=Lipomyces japonicus TaxID=56871 RepID=UPI0034CD26D8